MDKEYQDPQTLWQRYQEACRELDKQRHLIRKLTIERDHWFNLVQEKGWKKKSVTKEELTKEELMKATLANLPGVKGIRFVK